MSAGRVNRTVKTPGVSPVRVAVTGQPGTVVNVNDGRAALLSELQANTSPTVIAAVYHALGAAPPRSGKPDAASLPPVLGHFMTFDDQLLTVYVISAGRFLRYEMTRNGVAMTTCVPLTRVARVVEQTEGTLVRLTVEIDADRVAVAVSGASSDIEGDSNPRGMRLEGGLFPAAVVIDADGDAGSRLGVFARLVRVALAS